jgi:hypothetical protein
MSVRAIALAGEALSDVPAAAAVIACHARWRQRHVPFGRPTMNTRGMATIDTTVYIQKALL